jgi:predicted PurR-regulated permease PerM
MPSTDKAMTSNGSIRVSLVICAIILLSAALYFASSVFAPLAFALFILAIVWPLQHALERRLPNHHRRDVDVRVNGRLGA